MKKKIMIILVSIVAFWFLLKLLHVITYDEEKHKNKYINSSFMLETGYDSGVFIPE